MADLNKRKGNVLSFNKERLHKQVPNMISLIYTLHSQYKDDPELGLIDYALVQEAEEILKQLNK